MKKNKKKISVCHVIYNLSTAGAQTVVMNYLRFMENIPNIDISVLVRDKFSGYPYEMEAKRCGYKVYYSGYEPWKGLRIIRPFVNWIRCQILMYKSIKKINPDIIHTHLAGIMPYTLFPSIISKVSVRVHTLHSDPYAIPMAFALWTKVAVNYFKVFPICVTEDQAEKAKKRYRIKELKVIHNGLDIEKYNLNESKQEIRESMSIPQNSFVIGTVGTLYKTKNVEFLIDIYNKYKEKHLNSFLLIVGDGKDRKMLEEKCESLGISRYLFTGRRDDVERMYKAMDIFVSTSLHESSSIVTVEAQLSGLRCVVSEAVPASVVISDYVNRISLDEPIEKWIDALEGKVPFVVKKNEPEAFTISRTIEDTCNLYNKLLERIEREQ